MTPGYYRLPDVNRERLVDGWLKTGDVFARDADGFFYFLGRPVFYPLEHVLLKHPPSPRFRRADATSGDG